MPLVALLQAIAVAKPSGRGRRPCFTRLLQIVTEQPSKRSFIGLLARPRRSQEATVTFHGILRYSGCVSSRASKSWCNSVVVHPFVCEYSLIFESKAPTNTHISKHEMVCDMTVKACLIQVALLSLLAGSATAQWDPATGLIKPTSGPPVYDPVPWNGAYKVTFQNVPISSSTSGSPAWPRAPVRVVVTSQECSTDGFDTTPASTADVVSTTWRPLS
jgi:hypothetical protein